MALAPIYETLVIPDLSRRFERIQRSERPFELARESRSDTEVAAALYMKAQRLFDGGDAATALAEATAPAISIPTTVRSTCCWPGSIARTATGRRP